MSERIRVVVPGDDPPQIAGSAQLQRLAPYAEVAVFTSRPATPQEQLDRVRDARIIINSRGAVTWREEALRALPQLRMITTCSIGTDMVDLEVARELGIVVSNQPGRTASVVAEHMFGILFALAKRAAFQTAELKAGRWTRRLNTMLQGRKLGIIGTGHIGAEMARLGRALGMDVWAWTFHPTPARAAAMGVRFTELDELLSSCDVVSLHVKLTPDTFHLIGPEQLARMPQGALLLNGARGDVVDMAALVEALRSGHLGGAGLDVFSQEPLAVDDPILSCDQVVLTPHAADQTPEGVELLNEGAVDNVIAFLEGRPQNNVAA
jgi:phosphoglycerate dehydrogenase-like enzyme